MTIVCVDIKFRVSVCVCVFGYIMAGKASLGASKGATGAEREAGREVA